MCFYVRFDFIKRSCFIDEHKHIDMKYPFLDNQKIIDSLITSSLDFSELVAPSEAKYCAKIFCL